MWKLWWSMYSIFQHALQSPTQNTRLYCVTGKGEKDTGQRQREKKRADCSEPEQGQSSSVTLVLGQAELCSTWEPGDAHTHTAQRGKTEWEQRWVWSDRAAGLIVGRLETERSFKELSLMQGRLAREETWNLIKTLQQWFPKSKAGTDFNIIKPRKTKIPADDDSRPPM